MLTETNFVSPTCWGEREIKGPVHLFRERLLLRSFRPMLPSGRVLDAGCGSGSLAMELCRLGYDVEAVEQSAEFVNMVRERIASMGMESSLSVQSGSVTSLPFDDEFFDGLVSGEVLEHLAPESGGDEAAVAEFRRVLRPGGACVISVPLNPDLWDESDEWGRPRKTVHEGRISCPLRRKRVYRQCDENLGFPLGRLYHRALFGPWLRRTSGVPSGEVDGRADTKAASNRFLVGMVAGVLRFDELFSKCSWGRGIVLSAVKS